uniref:Barrier-to-autointegration factor 1 n=1 Tax=Gongylonema pulchrum TaxID=637853 RepID=A0A183DS49_9BILA
LTFTKMSTSVKHREFVSEPMGEKEVTAVAGIGPTYGEKLTKAGFDKRPKFRLFVQQVVSRANLTFTKMSTSVKHREFVSEPMGEKEVTAVAGIGPTYGEKLTKAGFDKFLLLKKEKQLFIDWFKDITGASSNHALSAYNCLNEWSEQYI